MQSIVRVAMPVTEGASVDLPPDSPAEDVFTAVTDRLASCEGPEQSVVVVPTRARRAPEVARAVAGHPGLAVVGITGPVTAQAMTDHVLRSSRLSAGQHVEVARGLTPYLRTYAVVSSVARVERPVPSFWQHLASILPWTRFGLDVHGESTVHPTQLPQTVPGTTCRVVTGPGARRSIVPELLPVAETGPDLLVQDAADTWGARHAVECTLLVGTVEEVVQQILSAPAQDCVNCHVATRLAVCPFCGVRQEALADRKVTA